MYICTQANHFFVEKEPCFSGTGMDTVVSIYIGIGRDAIEAVRYPACKSGCAGCLPVAGRFRDFLQLGGGYSGNTCPVPYGKDAGIFIACRYDIGTSVGHEVGFQVFTVSILTTGCPCRYHTDVECVARTYMQGIVSAEVMGMS